MPGAVGVKRMRSLVISCGLVTVVALGAVCVRAPRTSAAYTAVVLGSVALETAGSASGAVSVHSSPRESVSAFAQSHVDAHGGKRSHQIP